VFVEPLFCSQGCINGPCIKTGKSLFERRRTVAGHGKLPGKENDTNINRNKELFTIYKQCGNIKRQIREEEIQAVLERTGKASPEQQLNCGACGYGSCREKAIAVIEGMAEPEMCLPHMRRLAEQRTDRIIETSPNGIVILDEMLNIIGMNPAFRAMFMCSDAVLGRRISYLMDPEPFEKLASGAADRMDRVQRYSAYNLVCHQLVYALREERQYVGIFLNVTESQGDQRKLAEIRQQTVVQAQALLDHQIQMAQKIADFLGENTAQSEELVRRLIDLADENAPQRDPGDHE
jgi:PAS domain S-box-containing protein